MTKNRALWNPHGNSDGRMRRILKGHTEEIIRKLGGEPRKDSPRENKISRRGVCLAVSKSNDMSREVVAGGGKGLRSESEVLKRCQGLQAQHSIKKEWWSCLVKKMAELKEERTNWWWRKSA